MNLGQHLENGLTNLGNSIERIADKHRESAQQRYEHDLESDRLGLITDDEKLRLLKQDLYRVARGRGDCTGLCRAIATLETSIQAKHRRTNTFLGQVTQVFNYLVFLAVLATVSSFAVHGLCGSSQKPICQNYTQLSRYILEQFQEPR